MSQKVEIEFAASPSAEVLDALSKGLTDHSLGHVEKPGFSSVAWFHRDPEGKIDAGINGFLNWNWANVYNFWVAEPLRGQGIGKQLLSAFEEHAIAHGCDHIHLDTFTFQAPDLYEAWGYEQFATLENYPEGHARHFYRKKLCRT